MKKAIVMGASSGIGLEVARLLKQQGWTVGVAARRVERLAEFEHSACIDVNDNEAGQRLLELAQRIGGMDLYFHASGVGHQNRDLDEGIELQTVQTNGLGFTRMVGTAFRYMAGNGGGHIAVISSIAGTKGLGPAPSYSATKAFQNTYIQSLEQLANARRLNIRFTDLRPGFVATDLLNDGRHYPLLLETSAVAREMVRSIEKHRHVRVIDWRWRAITWLWRRIPRWLWRRLVLSLFVLFAVVPLQRSEASGIAAANSSLFTLHSSLSAGIAAANSSLFTLHSSLSAGIAAANSSLFTLHSSLFTLHSSLNWGDQGNGTYINPILNADYSDPDVIRVGEKYYMVASDFHFVGMQILESDDMVNWRILTQVYRRFAVDGVDLPGWDTNERYAGGSWAPALRYHDGKFWIYFCTPHEGLFMTQAERPEGPWSPLHRVKAVEKWEDPCPFWDDDGQAYLGRSQHGAGPIIVHRMSADGRQLLDDGVTVYTGPVAEGTKFLKRNGYYYLSIPEGGVGTGWQTVLRAKSIYGPYEKRVVLEQGTTAVNGPHQGAIVDTPDGQWWFYHFQHNGALGRVVHLQPMQWSDDWPVIGVDIDRNGIGEPVAVWTMPKTSEKLQATSEKAPAHFSLFTSHFSLELDPVWQWNHNPADEAWSLTEHEGRLTLHALKAADFRHARNTLTQRVVGYRSVATVCVDCSHIAEGGHAGLACMGKTDKLLDVTEIVDSNCRGKVWLRISFDMVKKEYRFAYCNAERGQSLEASPTIPADSCFTEVGEPFFVDFGNWKGVRFGIFHYNTLHDDGYITVEAVRYDAY